MVLFVVSMVLCVVAGVFLGFSVWLLGCCHGVFRVLCVVVKML